MVCFDFPENFSGKVKTQRFSHCDTLVHEFLAFAPAWAAMVHEFQTFAPA